MLAADNVPEPEARKQVILTAPFFPGAPGRGRRAFIMDAQQVQAKRESGQRPESGPIS